MNRAHSILATSSLLLLGGALLWLKPSLAGRPVAAALLATGIVGFVAFVLTGRGREPDDAESDDICQIEPTRHQEMLRGTSLHLREMKYRYSVRSGPQDQGNRRPFTADVNGIRLGFIPAIITDNSTDRQGYGYVAFVHDGQRWRGPGLPCPDNQEEAVRHAARCVAPLATEDETSF